MTSFKSLRSHAQNVQNTHKDDNVVREITEMVVHLTRLCEQMQHHIRALEAEVNGLRRKAEA